MAAEGCTFWPKASERLAAVKQPVSIGIGVMEHKGVPLFEGFFLSIRLQSLAIGAIHFRPVQMENDSLLFRDIVL